MDYLKSRCHSPDIRNYLFIDGSYLRRAYLDTMRKQFPSVHYRSLDLKEVKTSVDASKAFYYDATAEDADDAKQRKYNKTTWRATLLAGDLDFEPLQSRTW